MPVDEAGQGDDESCSYPEEKTAGGKNRATYHPAATEKL